MAVDEGAVVTRVKMALASDSRTALTDVLVEAVDGIVYLRGQVETERDIESALEVASEVEGVVEVRSHLSVMAVHSPNTVRVELPDSRPFAEGEDRSQ